MNNLYRNFTKDNTNPVILFIQNFRINSTESTYDLVNKSDFNFDNSYICFANEEGLEVWDSYMIRQNFYQIRVGILQKPQHFDQFDWSDFVQYRLLRRLPRRMDFKGTQLHFLVFVINILF